MTKNPTNFLRFVAMIHAIAFAIFFRLIGAADRAFAILRGEHLRVATGRQAVQSAYGKVGGILPVIAAPLLHVIRQIFSIAHLPSLSSRGSFSLSHGDMAALPPPLKVSSASVTAATFSSSIQKRATNNHPLGAALASASPLFSRFFENSPITKNQDHDRRLNVLNYAGIFRQMPLVTLS